MRNARSITFCTTITLPQRAPRSATGHDLSSPCVHIGLYICRLCAILLFSPHPHCGFVSDLVPSFFLSCIIICKSSISSIFVRSSSSEPARGFAVQFIQFAVCDATHRLKCDSEMAAAGQARSHHQLVYSENCARPGAC